MQVDALLERLDLTVDPEAKPVDVDQALAKFLLSVLHEKSLDRCQPPGEEKMNECTIQTQLKYVNERRS